MWGLTSHAPQERHSTGDHKLELLRYCASNLQAMNVARAAYARLHARLALSRAVVRAWASARTAFEVSGVFARNAGTPHGLDERVRTARRST